MLTYRLTGTTEAIGVEPERTPPSSPATPNHATTNGQGPAAAANIFANHGEPSSSTLLTCA